MTTVVISQPMLFPWAGFFELAAQADIYVHLDDAQFSKGGFTNRIQIKHPAGVKWMTIPLEAKGSFQPIRDLQGVGSDWKRRHRALVAQALDGTAHTETALELFDRVYARDRVVELLVASIEDSAEVVGLSRPAQWVLASELGIAGTSWQRVLAMVRELGGTRYLTAHGAAGYLDHEAFEQAGVAVEYVEYSKTPYDQLHGPFTPYVSILDTIATLGERARSVICPKAVPWREFVARKSTS